jgi:hypothetical protein
LRNADSYHTVHLVIVVKNIELRGGTGTQRAQVSAAHVIITSSIEALLGSKLTANLKIGIAFGEIGHGNSRNPIHCQIHLHDE